MGELAYGLQFHVEFSKEMTERWINEDKLFITKVIGTNWKNNRGGADKKSGEKTIPL